MRDRKSRTRALDERFSDKYEKRRTEWRREMNSNLARRLIPLGFLAPRIVEAIAEGRQPVDLTVEALTRRIELPILWSAQHQALGIK